MAEKRSTAPEPVGPPSDATSKEPLATPSETVATVEKKKTPWFRFSVMTLFGVVYAWDLFWALWNFIELQADLANKNEVRALNNFSLIDTPWVPILANLILPIAVFGLALWISRSRSVGILAVMLFAGLGVVAAVNLSLTAYVLAITPPL
jgi:hypothetical protein